MDERADSLEEGEILGDITTASSPNHDFSLDIDAPDRNQHMYSQPEDEDWEKMVGKRKRKKNKKEKYVQEQHNKAPVPSVDSGNGQSLMTKLYGTNPRASVEIKESNAIRLADVQNLVLWVLGETCCPRWVFLKGKPLVQQVVLMLAHGLSQDLFEQHKDLLPTFASFGTPAVVVGLNTTVRPGQTVSALLHLPARKQKKRKTSAGNHVPPFPPSHYVVTFKQMEEHHYPLPELQEDGTLQCPAGFVATQPTDGGPPSAPELVGLDCEMCITANGFEVTRVTLVGREGNVLLDELVLPDSPITDYNTRFSGITAAMLADCTNRLPDVQARFLSIVKAETLLVGHALENDLMALKVIHANCLDTAVLYPHPKGPPYKSALKVLTQKFLKRSIQQGSHDSVVDAKAAMDLTLLKIKHGPAYGTEDGRDVEKLADVLAEHQVRSCLVDHPAALQRYATGSCSAVAATDDEDAARRMAKAVAATVAGGSGSEQDVNGPMPLYRFVWTQFSTLNSFHSQRAFRLRAQLLPQSAALDGWTPAPPQETPPSSHPAGAEAPCSSDKLPSAAANGKRKHSGDCENAAGASPESSKPHKKVRKGMHADDDASSGEGAEEEVGREGDASTPPPPPAEGGVGDGALGKEEEELRERLRSLDAHISRVHSALPPNSLLVVVTGQGDTAHIRLLQEMKYKRQSGVDDLPPWNLNEEEKMNELATSAIRGLCFCCVKQ